MHPDPSQQVTVSRDGPTDPRTDCIPESVAMAGHPVMTTRTGGKRHVLPHPMVGLGICCTDVPNVAHGGEHGPCPHRSIFVIVVPEQTDPDVYARLCAEAEFNGTPEGHARKIERRRVGRRRRRALARAVG